MNLLDRLQLSFRCPADWSAMEGDETRRFCTTCQKHVHDLSALTREEAEDFMSRQQTSVCIRMLRRPDGSTVVKDCPRTGVPPLVKTAGLALAAGGALALASCSEKETPPPVMGKIAPPAKTHQSQSSQHQQKPREKHQITTKDDPQPEMGEVKAPPQVEPPQRELMGIVCPPPGQ